MPFSNHNPPNFSDLPKIQNAAPYFCHPRLSRYPQLSHAVFTRKGGFSDPPFNSLNTCYKVGDRQINVTENLERIKKVIGTSRLMHMNQCHGDHILVLKKFDIGHQDEPPTADAMITNIPNVALMVKMADCQGVIIFDPARNVLAVVHCGWRGNVQNILGKVVFRMNDAFDCEGADLLAAIGPSLGPCCAEFDSYKKTFPKSFERFMIRDDFFDLWAISSQQLIESGLTPENIEIAGICTRCRADLFFSYRAEGKTGRFGTVAMLRQAHPRVRTRI